MAKVILQLLGGDPQNMEARTVADLKSQLRNEGDTTNYTASVNGNPVKDDHVLQDYNVVVLTENTKGG